MKCIKEKPKKKRKKIEGWNKRDVKNVDDFLFSLSW